MTLWDEAAGALNGALDATFAEPVTITRPGAARRPYVPAGIDPDALATGVMAVVTEEPDRQASSGEGGSTRFPVGLETGVIEISFERGVLGFDLKKGDRIQATARADAPTWELVADRPNDGGRIDVQAVRV